MYRAHKAPANRLKYNVFTDDEKCSAAHTKAPIGARPWPENDQNAIAWHSRCIENNEFALHRTQYDM